MQVTECKHSVPEQWNLPYPDLFYPDTSIVRTAQIGCMACSLLTIMKFGLDESTRKEPKDCYYLFGGLIILLIITTSWLQVIMHFYSPDECSVVTSPSSH